MGGLWSADDGTCGLVLGAFDAELVTVPHSGGGGGKGVTGMAVAEASRRAVMQVSAEPESLSAVGAPFVHFGALDGKSRTVLRFENCKIEVQYNNKQEWLISLGSLSQYMILQPSITCEGMCSI